MGSPRRNETERQRPEDPLDVARRGPVSQSQSCAVECARTVLPELWRSRECQGELQRLRVRSTRRPAPRRLDILRRLRPATDQEPIRQGPPLEATEIAGDRGAASGVTPEYEPSDGAIPMISVSPCPILYQSFWCEENIWQLVQHPAAAAKERLVLVITGAEAQVACWKQKAGNDIDPVLWDYHVVLATRGDAWRVWDLDSRLGFPVAAQTWMQKTFPFPERVAPRFQPRFAAIPAEDYLREFGSDRSHMRDVHGKWQQPPPPWTAIDGQGLHLADVIQLARQGLDLEALQERLM